MACVALRLIDVVEPPVRAGCVVLKCKHGEVGVGTMVQAGEAPSGMPKSIRSRSCLSLGAGRGNLMLY